VLLPAFGRLMPVGSAGDPGGRDRQCVFQDGAQVARAEVFLVREREKAGCIEGQGAVGTAVAGQQAAGQDAGPGGRLRGGEVLTVQVGQGRDPYRRGRQVDRAELLLTTGAGLVGGCQLLQTRRFPRETGGDTVDLLDEGLDIVGYNKGFFLQGEEEPGGLVEGDGGLDRAPSGRQSGRAA